MRIHICKKNGRQATYRRNYWTLKYSVGRKTRQQPIEFRVYRFATLPFRGSCRQTKPQIQGKRDFSIVRTYTYIRILTRKNIARSLYRYGRTTDRLPSLISNQWQPSRYNGRIQVTRERAPYDNLDVEYCFYYSVSFFYSSSILDQISHRSIYLLLMTPSPR